MADADLRFFLGGGTALSALRLPSIIIGSRRMLENVDRLIK